MVLISFLAHLAQGGRVGIQRIDDHSLAHRIGFCINEEYYGFLVVAGLAGYLVDTAPATKVLF